jgi:hypothetical protein
MNTGKRAWERLVEARPDGLDPEPDSRRRERDLARVLALPPGATEPRRRRPRAWLIPVAIAVGTSAAAIVGAAVVIPSLGPGSDGSPVTSATNDSPRPQSSPPPETTAVTARQVLLAAAATAERQGAAEGRIWQTRTTSGAVEQVVGAEYLIEIRWRDEVRLDASSSDGTWTRTELGGRPARPADEAAWRSAGSPRSWKVVQPGPCQANSEMSVCESERSVGSEPGKPDTQPLQQTAMYWLAGRNVTAEDLARLPVDPAKLKTELLKGYNGCGSESCDGQQVRIEDWLFQSASGLVTEMPAAPGVRAAAYRMLADLPGITVVQETRDPLNRKAVALTMRHTEGDGEYETRLLLDPKTWNGLAVENYIVDDSRRPWAVAGLRWHYTAVESAGWVGE